MERNNSLIRKGDFVIAYGSMKSGKSEEITSIVHKLEIAKSKGFTNNYQLFKPSNDTRDGPFIVSRASSLEHPLKYPATFVDYNNPKELLNYLETNTKMVGIDELQFFDRGIVGVIEELLRNNIYVVGAGLDLDFRREPFGAMSQLINLATERVSKKAICDVCGGMASLTQRLNPDGSSSSYYSPVVAVEQVSVLGEKSKKKLDYIYEARCFHCYEIPDGPFKTEK